MSHTPDVRPLHLHTVESLCADLVSGRAVGVGANNNSFALERVQARSVLQWYVANRGKWAGNVFAGDCEAIADSIDTLPKISLAVIFTTGGTPRKLRLVKLRAHRFAGLHRYRKASQAPEDFELDFRAPITFFEGANGAGKTSILNAIVWALTGQLFRPQRAPEAGLTEFECELAPASGEQEPAIFRTAPVVPLPDLDLERPQGPGLVDTWVELSFEDDDGSLVPTVRRELARTSRGKLTETHKGLDTLGVDPVSVRSGTVMAALLPFIQIGGPSALGQAVAELTGLAPLAQLTKHAAKARARLLGDSAKERLKEIEQADQGYNRSRADLLARVHEVPSLAFTHSLPEPQEDGVEDALKLTKLHFDDLSATRLSEAKEVLGDAFNPQNDKDRRNLQDSIAPALADLAHIRNLASASRLADLGSVTAEDRQAAQNAISKLLDEAAGLVLVAQDGSRAARLRLYAAIASWRQVHPQAPGDAEKCPVCDASLKDSRDPVTGQTVLSHIEQAGHSDAQVAAQTLVQWATAAAANLTAQLPTALQAEMKKDLPEHPSALVQAALGQELWTTEPFNGVIQALKESTRTACEAALANVPPLAASELPDLNSALPGLTNLRQSIARVDRALRFSRWRSENDQVMRDVFQSVVGRASSSAGPASQSLAAKLQKLQVIVESVGPIRQAQELCVRMEADFTLRKAKLQRIERYKNAAQALQDCSTLGTLAEEQVAQLQTTLQTTAVEWRNRIYQGAWPATNFDMVRLGMETDGKIQIQVGSSGVSAPAQHVSNASALRASLIAFYLAYWQHLQQERGGLRLLVLDDPQELLDGDNRHRLADSLARLANEGAQLLVTTYDRPFAQLLVLAGRAEKLVVDHRSVHPPSKERPTLQTSPSVAEIQRLHEATCKDENDPIAAREYASECRVFIETRLGDLFDDSAFPLTSATSLKLPTLMEHVNRLRGAVKSPGTGELFRSPVMNELAKDPALADRSAPLTLLNKAHHRQKVNIQPAEVKACRTELERLRKLAERAHEEFRLFLRRERRPSEFDAIPSLELAELPTFSLAVRPNLLAFVRGAATGESQEANVGTVDQTWFEDKAFFFLRTSNFGFASTVESVAVVEAVPSAVPDRHLVIARRGDEVYARRLLRPETSDFISLASETPDPRNSRPTLQFHHREVALHKVVGMFFHVGPLGKKGRGEAVQIEGKLLLERIRSAFKVQEQSAIPLALEGQIALGGALLGPGKYDTHLEEYAALNLSDGSTIFKRIGTSLCSPLAHVRQFESIGGLGVADVLAVDKPEAGFRAVESAVSILGVLYHA